MQHGPKRQTAFSDDKDGGIGPESSKKVTILASGTEVTDVEEAIAIICGGDADAPADRSARYRIEVRWSSGAVVRGDFPTGAEAAAFLRSLCSFGPDRTLRVQERSTG